MLALASQSFAQFGYLIVGLAMLAEGLTLPCPAVAILLMAGAAVATGRLSFWLVVGIAALSYSMGSYVPYMLGKHCTRLDSRSWAGKLIAKSAKHLDLVAKIFARYGEPSVALTRPFWIGNFVSYFAGLGKMPLFRFLLFTFGGIMAWSAVVVSVGKLLSKDLPLATSLIQKYSFFATLLFLALATIYALTHRKWLFLHWRRLNTRQ